MKVLMVCLGNICRSPLAEGILREKVRQKGLSWIIDSAGTGSWHIGESPDPRSVDIARTYGLDITTQRARQIAPRDLDEYDLILTMDSSNYNDVLRLAVNDQQREKIDMIMNFVSPDKNQSVPDPYWDDDGFEKVFTMLERACEVIVERYG